MLRFPLDEDALGRRVNIISGELAGASGVIMCLADEQQPNALQIELDGDRGKVWGNVWIETVNLEEEPLSVTTDRPQGCPFCLKPTIEDDGAVYIEQGAYDGNNSYEAEGDAPRYRCTSDGCGKSFVVW